MFLSAVRVRSIVLIAAVLYCQTAVTADRYVAWLADGTPHASRALTAWPLPGGSFRLENHDLATVNNPVRLIRDRYAASRRKPPYVTFANGDIVGGTLVELDSSEARSGNTLRVRLEPEPPLMPVTGTTIAVRCDHILRAAGAMTSLTDQPPPGTVVFADGRRVTARSIRWRERGLALLTDDGVVEAPFADVADVVLPGSDRSSAILEDNLWATDHPLAIARFQSTSGAVLTAARVTREQEPARRRGRVANTVLYLMQPAWTDQPLAIPEQEIVSCSYRAANEVPLTMFPATTVASAGLTAPPRPCTLNHDADGSVLAATGRESDLGLATHAFSAVAFELPAAARSLETSVGLNRNVGDGGCVRCKVLADAGEPTRVLWDSGVLLGKDGVKSTSVLDVRHLTRVQLVTDYAHHERPAGADPLDIRDAVVWLTPLVKLDASFLGAEHRAAAMLQGLDQWELAGGNWQTAEITSRWNMPASAWDSVLAIRKDAQLTFRRTLRVSRGSDVLELLTICPADLAEHDFSLSVNGTAVPWHNNADRNQLRQWTLRYSRTRAERGEEESNLTDRLAYWWDLAPWRDQDVTLELVIRGARERSEIAWRSLAIRSAIAGPRGEAPPLEPDIPLDRATALRYTGSANPTASNQQSRDRTIRLLGQAFDSGISLSKSDSISYKVMPDYQRFVAVVGCSVQVAGPVQVLIDDRVVWQRAAISSLAATELIDIPIPTGAKTLTLQSGAEGLYYGTVAFVEAGFMKSPSK